MNNEHLSTFEPLSEEECVAIKKEINDLRNKDWSTILNAIGFEHETLVHANQIVHQFCLGVADTIEDQLKRNLIRSGYEFPRIVIVSSELIASFKRYFNLIKVSMETLHALAIDNHDEIVHYKMGGKVLFSGIATKMYYYLGNEEAKHSIDFHAGKMLSVVNGTPTLEYHNQRHEYLGLGEKVLRAKKRGDMDVFFALKKFLNDVIEYGRNKKSQ